MKNVEILLADARLVTFEGRDVEAAGLAVFGDRRFRRLEARMFVQPGVGEEQHLLARRYLRQDHRVGGTEQQGEDHGREASRCHRGGMLAEPRRAISSAPLSAPAAARRAPTAGPRAPRRP